MGRQMIHGSVEPGFEAVESPKESAVYEIMIEGHLAPHRVQQFEGLEVTHQSYGETSITGPIPDQSALLGLLNWLHDLGAVLVSVRRLKPSG
jgi:hypothetical protein